MHTQRRSMLGYLTLPRPGDLVKWIILPVGFLVGSALRGLPGPGVVAEAVVVWLALELLVYQARYQWNDIKGFEADQRHPDGDRGRLPGPVDRRRSRVTWSASTAGVKVLVAIGGCLLLSPETAWMMVGLTAGVFGLAVVYEALRDSSTGRTDAAPPAVTAGIAGIWLVIGGGYALRAVTGLWLAVDLLDPPLLAAGAVLACWALGTAWITSRWCLEATSFARLEGRGLRWETSRESAKEHQTALVRWLPSAVPATVEDPRSWRAVHGGTPWRAPWHVAGLLALTAAAGCGVLLSDPGARIPAVLLCVALGLAGGALLLAAGPRRVAGTALATPLLVGGYALAGVDRPVAAVLPWLVIAAAQACYLRQDRASLGTFLRRRPPGPPAGEVERRPTSAGGQGQTWIPAS